MDFAETIRGIFGGQSSQPPPAGDDYAAPLRPMVDPAARTRAVGGSPEFQGKVDETLRDALRETAEPFKQVGRAISGRSDNPVPEALLGGLGMATAIPGGLARGALKAGAKLGGEALEDIIAPAAKKATTGGVEDMIKAYHGSPHDFDRFDLSKIGTGEGAQAYGHGLYFAEHEGVAKQYRDQLQWKGADFNDTHVIAQNAIDRHNGDRAAAADSLQSAVDSTVRFHRGKPPASQAAANAETEKAITLLRSGEPVTGKPPAPGRMYEVGIRANPEHFLDWDKPLSEQHPKVREAAKTMKYLPGEQRELGQLKGREILNSMHGTDQEATAALREAGIPGIKYLDQGSRGKGDGTRNYVVFDDKLIDILKKYGIAGIGALPAMNAFHYQDKQ